MYVFSQIESSFFVSNYALTVIIFPLWIIDSGEIDHMMRDRVMFVEYQRFQLKVGGYILKTILAMRFNALAHASQTYKKKSPLLHDVIYVLDIQRNLIFVSYLLVFCYKLIFQLDIIDIIYKDSASWDPYMPKTMIRLETK